MPGKSQIYYKGRPVLEKNKNKGDTKLTLIINLVFWTAFIIYFSFKYGFGTLVEWITFGAIFLVIFAIIGGIIYFFKIAIGEAKNDPAGFADKITDAF